MDVIVGIVALVIAVGCAAAIFLASRRQRNAEKDG